MRPVRYNPESEYGDPDKEYIGLIAEEVLDVFPEFVTKNEEGQPEGLIYEQMVALLIKEVQSLRNENRDLRSAIDSINAKL